jgi:hypothetical protein
VGAGGPDEDASERRFNARRIDVIAGDDEAEIGRIRIRAQVRLSQQLKASSARYAAGSAEACHVMRILLLSWVTSASLVASQWVSLPFYSCSSATTAAANDVLDVGTILGQFDSGQTQAGQWGPGATSRLAANESGNVLRMVALANVGQQSSGFSNLTNFLGEHSPRPPRSDWL